MLTTLDHREPPTVLKLLAHEVRWQLLAVLAYSDYRVNELVARLQKPMNLVSYHLRLLRDAAIVSERRSAADGRDIYYSLDLTQFQAMYKAALGSLHPALVEPTQPKGYEDPEASHPLARVLFLCTHNSARSQMAEALLRHLGGQRVEVYSAGTAPATVHPKALEILQKKEIDTNGLYPKHLDQFRDQNFDFVITVCDRAREACPIFPNDPERIHWSFPDPVTLTDPDQQHRAFLDIFVGLEKRLNLLLALIQHNQGETITL